MKVLPITLALLVSILTTAFAQTEKGRWAAGGQGSFYYNSQSGYNTFSADLSPTAGYFFADNLLIGSGIKVSYISASNNQFNAHTRYTSVGLSPFVRYYLGKANLRPYGSISYTYSVNNQRTETPGTNTNLEIGHASSISPTIGMAYFINRTASIDAGLIYVRNWSNNPATSPTYTTNYVTLSVGFQLFFGK